MSRERIAETSDPVQFLTATMNDPEIDIRLRVEAAKVLLRFICRRATAEGKKERQAEAAKKVAGRFSASTPPNITPMTPH